MFDFFCWFEFCFFKFFFLIIVSFIFFFVSTVNYHITIFLFYPKQIRISVLAESESIHRISIRKHGNKSIYIALRGYNDLSKSKPIWVMRIHILFRDSVHRYRGELICTRLRW